MSKRLDMCRQCGRHGRFLLSKKRPSRDFGSKEHAYVELQELFSHKLITRTELTALSEAVRKCDSLSDTLPKKMECPMLPDRVEEAIATLKLHNRIAKTDVH